MRLCYHDWVRSISQSVDALQHQGETRAHATDSAIACGRHGVVSSNGRSDADGRLRTWVIALSDYERALQKVLRTIAT